MNRLVLIGNGFDLAHGLKTSYYDFILDYLKSSFEKARLKDNYEDELIVVNGNREYIIPEFNDVMTLKQFLIFQVKNYPNGPIYLNQGDDPSLNVPKTAYKLCIKNTFFETLLCECSKYNWVDIENKYYQFLKIILGEKDLKIKEESLYQLNDSLIFLIKKLREYLSVQKLTYLNIEYNSIFSEFINKDEVVFPLQLSNGELPRRTMFLNFNYTDTLSNYFTSNSYRRLEIPGVVINCIHGKVNSDKDPIVFGFGDELDKDYSRIESEETKGFLKFIKSFWYFKTSNYHDLIRFIESDDFQVFIVGHSCGLSDRTMLNMIFEHQNCKSIKIFYHEKDGKNNYTELTEEISRHFTSKGDMRMKIVPLNKSSAMPQVKI